MRRLYLSFKSLSIKLVSRSRYPREIMCFRRYRDPPEPDHPCPASFTFSTLAIPNPSLERDLNQIQDPYSCSYDPSKLSIDPIKPCTTPHCRKNPPPSRPRHPLPACRSNSGPLCPPESPPLPTPHAGKSSSGLPEGRLRSAEWAFRGRVRVRLKLNKAGDGLVG